jgi:2-C-methyl-D-erythritol 4-phosphate cytidylyltransferase
MELAAIVPLSATVHAAAFAPVAGEVALIRVVRALLGPMPASGVIVVADDSLLAEARACLDSAGMSAVSVIASGAPGTRHRCLAAAVEHLGGEPHPATHVLVHDHRHPLAPVDVTERVIDGLRAGHGVVVPVLPMTDTVKAVDDRGAVIDTVDRTALRTVQYPRGYQSAVLAQSITRDADEFAVALAAGTPIVTVDGDADGFAVELPTDAPLLGAVSATHHRG